MRLEGNGDFRVRVSMASGAIPIEGATVIVRGVNQENGDIAHLLISDLDGLTQSVLLPAPNIDYSLTPQLNELPYSRYSVEVIKNGFNKEYAVVNIFDERSAYQEFNLLPQDSGQTVID